MNADELLQWKTDTDHVDALTRAAYAAELDAVMADLGFTRGDDGDWVKRPLPVPAPRPAPVPVRVPKPRPPADRTAA